MTKKETRTFKLAFIVETTLLVILIASLIVINTTINKELMSLDIQRANIIFGVAVAVIAIILIGSIGLYWYKNNKTKHLLPKQRFSD